MDVRSTWVELVEMPWMGIEGERVVMGKTERPCRCHPGTHPDFRCGTPAMARGREEEVGRLGRGQHSPAQAALEGDAGVVGKTERQALVISISK